MIYEYKENNDLAIVEIPKLEVGQPVKALQWLIRHNSNLNMWTVRKPELYRKLTQKDVQILKLENL